MRPTRLHNNVLVVCHANVCRSPLVAAILRKELSNPDRVRDRGLRTRNSVVADKIKRYAAEVLDIDFSGHQVRELNDDDVEWADLIVYMDAANFKRLREWYPDDVEKMYNLGHCINRRRVADPLFLSEGPKFRELLQEITRAANLLAELLER